MTPVAYHNGGAMRDVSCTLAPASIPAELRDLDQWVCWKYGPPAEPDGKRPKVPYIPSTDRKASSTNPKTWRPFAEALAAVEAGKADGLGVVLTEHDPYTGVDLDGVRDPETGTIIPEAQAIIDRLATFTEISPSGTGVHILMRAVKPDDGCVTTLDWGKVEAYDNRRFLTITGDVLPGHDRLRNAQAELTKLHREIFRPAQAPGGPAQPAPPMILTMDDREILDRIGRERGGKGAALIAGNWAGYPTRSEARAALGWKVLFYSDDVEQIARILVASPLWADDETERERNRKAQRDAKQAAATYTGARWQPASEPAPAPGSSVTWGGADPDPTTCDQVRADLAAARRQIADLEARVSSQAKMIRYERSRIEAIQEILSCGEIDAGPRLIAAGAFLEVDHQERKGAPAGEHGWQVPASWLARRTGMTEKAAGRHLRTLATLGIIDRTVVNLTKGERAVDENTGEIFEVDVPRKAGFISTPAEAIVSRLADYRRAPEAPRHGGTRTPACPDHPDAKVVRKWTDHCSVCNRVLDTSEDAAFRARTAGRTDQDPPEILAPTGTDDGTPKMGIPYPHVTDSRDMPKMGIPAPTPSGGPMMRPSVAPIDMNRRIANIVGE